jgi:uncharacterized protein YcbK (DUF882 family)
MNKDLIRGLELLRGLVSSHLGQETPLVITSGYRCTKHNKAVGGVKLSYHTMGYAADVLVPPGLDVDRLATFARNAGFKRIGLYHKQGFVHVDVGQKPSPARWEE